MSLKMDSVGFKNFRYVVHLLAYLVFLVPHYLPLPYAPEFLHDIFGGQNGALVTALVLVFYVLFVFSLTIWFLIEWISKSRFSEALLIEAVCFPIWLIAIAYVLNITAPDPAQRIAALNAGKSVAEFRNPYLSYKMLDCRNLTDHFDVVFIPQHLGIETDYLAYAPRRSEKKPLDGRGVNYGNDWYSENSGSMWSDALRNCKLQNRSPH